MYLKDKNMFVLYIIKRKNNNFYALSHSSSFSFYAV